MASGENADKKKFLGWFREDGTEFTAEDFLKTGAQIAGKQDGNLTENVELDLLQSSVMYIMSITKQIMESMVESFILKHWQMVKKLYLFQKIMIQSRGGICICRLVRERRVQSTGQ